MDILGKTLMTLHCFIQNIPLLRDIREFANNVSQTLLVNKERSTHVASLTSVIKYNTHPGLLVSRILTGSFLNCNHSFPWIAPSYLKFNIKIYSLLLKKYQVEKIIKIH